MYPYLKSLIQLWPGDWVNQMAKMNEMVSMENHILMSRGKKRLKLVRHFTKARIMEVYWLHSIGSCLWDEKKQALE